VTRIGELGTLAVASNRSTLHNITEDDILHWDKISFETSASAYKTTWRHAPHDHNLSSYRREDLGRYKYFWRNFQNQMP
jgi:hypothetical protein